jgi:hypothetical protein
MIVHVLWLDQWSPIALTWERCFTWIRHLLGSSVLRWSGSTVIRFTSIMLSFVGLSLESLLGGRPPGIAHIFYRPSCGGQPCLHGRSVLPVSPVSVIFKKKTSVLTIMIWYYRVIHGRSVLISQSHLPGNIRAGVSCFSPPRKIKMVT